MRLERIPPVNHLRLLAAALSGFVLLLITSISGAQSGWSPVPTNNAPPLRQYGTTFVYDDANNRLIMFGGNIGSPTNEVWVLPNAFGGGLPQWVKLNPTGAAPQGRSNHGAVYDAATNRMIVFGGCTGNCQPVTNVVSILEHANGLGGTPNWIQPFIAGSAPLPRQGFAMAYDAALNSVIVYGGQDGSGSLNLYADTWMLSNANGFGGTPQWTLAQAGGGPPGRYYPSSAYDPFSKHLIVTGGITTSGVQTNATWVFKATSAVSGSWQNPILESAPGNPPPFANIEAGYDPATQRMFVPITNAATQTKDVWVLENESTWTQLAPPALSPYNAAVDATIYRSPGNVLLSFFSNGAINQLWAINPELNSAPAFIAPTPGNGSTFTLRAGQDFAATVNALDANSGDTVTVAVNGLPAGASSGTNGPANPANRDVTWRPSYTQTGSHTLSFTAQDNHGASAATSFTVNVTPDSPPVFGGPTPFAPFNVMAGTNVNFTVQASDPDPGDGFTVNVDVSTLPAGHSSFGNGFGNPASRSFSWTPNNNQAGQHIIRFSATDLAGAMTEHAVTINVTANSEPFFIPPTPFVPLTVNAGSPISFTATAIDNDPNQNVQIMVDFNTLPSGVSVSPVQGTNPAQVNFSWTPSSGQAGPHTVTVTAKDSLNASLTHAITINVLPVVLSSIKVTPPSASKHNGNQFFSATGTFSDGSTQQLQSGPPTNQSGAPMWEVLFSPMLNAAQCETQQYPASAIGDWASQSIIDHNGTVDELWSPGTPVLNVDGSINPGTVSLTIACTNGSASGSINATWTGTRYEGTFSLGASSGNVTLTGWSTKASMPSPRFGFGAATADGKVYAIGGVSNFNVLDRVDSYDPATNAWTSGLAPMPTPRSGHGVVAINNLIYAVGGSIPGDTPSGVLEVYNPASNTWSTGYPAMPTPRAYVMAVEAGGKLYVIGGHDGPNNTNPLGTIEMYDPQTNAWTTGLTPMPTPEHFGAAGVLGNSIIVAGVGGTQKYNLTTGAWSAGVPIPGGRGAMAGGVTNGGFIVVGGQNGSGLVYDTLVYYPQHGNQMEGWAWLGSIPTARAELAAAVVGDLVYAIGGHTGGNSPLPGVPALDVLSVLPFGHLQTGFGGTSNVPTVQWSSSNPAVATIDASGNAQTVSPGTTTIIATSGNVSCMTTNECATFTVTNNPPSVSITNGPFSRNESSNSVFINSSASDSDFDFLTYLWSIVSGPGTISNPSSFNANYVNTDGPGVATIQLKVTDGYGASAIATTTVTTLNVAPSVSIFGSGGSIQEGSTFTTSGNFQDPGADTWTATVDYGDGTGVQPLALSGKNFNLSHIYADNRPNNASYTITVTVTDDDLGVGVATRNVFVNNVNPSQIMLNGSTTVLLGQGYSASGSFNDPGADSWMVTVNYGDGTGDQTFGALPNRTFALSHTYTSAGSFPLSVKVTDDDGGFTQTSRTITVNEPVSPPTFSQLPNTPAGECVCTQRASVTDQNQHNWFVKADASGSLKVTLTTRVLGTAAKTVEARIIDVTNGTQVGQTISVSYGANTPLNADFSGDTTVAVTPGGVYRVNVRAPNQMQSFALYWLRFDGAVEAGVGSPSFPSMEGGFMTWLVNVDATDGLALRLYTQNVPQGGPVAGPVIYQWVAPNGQAEPIQTFNVAEPVPPAFVDTTIPAPAGLAPGIWKLRLYVDFDYRLDKQTGVDRGLYLDHLSSGRGSIKINLVDGNGAPFTDTVNMSVSFGVPFFSIPITGGTLDVPDAEAFIFHAQLTLPDGFQTATPEFDILVTCDKLTEITIVITPIAPPQPPTISLQLSPNVIWPPNNKMVTATATITASSPDGHPTTVELVSITSNEPAAGDITGAAFGTDDRTFEVRAKRLGGGAGRIYTVTYRATDTVTGLSTLVSGTIVVPHDQGK
jgi:hypothetical protein